MATIDQVEQLRKRAEVSYQDAKDALEACDDDLLDALIYLEKQGKAKPPEHGGRYSTKRSAAEKDRNTPPPTDEESIRSLFHKFFNWIVKWVRKGNKNYFNVYRKGEHIFSLPITALIVIIALAFHTSILILLIGLLAGFRYYLRGPDVSDSDTGPESYKENKNE